MSSFYFHFHSYVWLILVLLKFKRVKKLYVCIERFIMWFKAWHKLERPTFNLKQWRMQEV